MKCLIYFFFFLLSSPLSYGVGHKTTKAMTGRQRKLHEILFPNKTKPYDYNDEQSSFFKRSSSLPSSSSSEVANRMLLPDLSNPPDGVSDALCEVCRGLTYCSALNGLLIQEVYYPSSNSEFGTCTIIDSLGERMYNEIFGIGRTFRDTPQCRLIVMQYLCLFWGTENDMYRNLCFWKEETQDPDPTKHKVTGRPPCRSFCVQIAEVCANQEDFIDICYGIVCPPTGDECTPDPTVGGEVVTTDIACDVPALSNPYGAASRVEVSVLYVVISLCGIMFSHLLW